MNCSSSSSWLSHGGCAAGRVIVEGAMETPIHEQTLENREAIEQALA
jgi:hypothetical protein